MSISPAGIFSPDFNGTVWSCQGHWCWTEKQHSMCVVWIGWMYIGPDFIMCCTCCVGCKFLSLLSHSLLLLIPPSFLSPFHYNPSNGWSISLELCTIHCIHYAINGISSHLLATWASIFKMKFLPEWKSAHSSHTWRLIFVYSTTVMCDRQ